MFIVDQSKSKGYMFIVNLSKCWRGTWETKGWEPLH